MCQRTSIKYQKGLDVIQEKPLDFNDRDVTFDYADEFKDFTNLIGSGEME